MTDIQLTHELIDQLNKLTSRLTAQGEYDAVDLIDTVVERVTEMPQRELLREALEALQVFADYAKAYDEYSLAQFGLVELDTHVMGNVHRGNPGRHPKDVVMLAGDLRRP